MKIIRKVKPRFTDRRGAIIWLLDDGKTKIKSVLLITSKKGSVRSNHYHKKDTHWLYVVSGKMEYYEKPVKGGKIKKAILDVGDMVYTPSMMIHATKFLKDTVLFTLSTRSRNQEDYEKDTVRIKLITDNL